MFNKMPKIALVLALLSATNGAVGQEPAQPVEVRYLNEIRGVYVGEEQFNRKTRVIIHRKDQGGVTEIHLVNGRRLTVLESRTIHDLLIGEVEMESGKSLNVYSGVFNLDGKDDDEKLMVALRASGAKPFCVKAFEIPLQAGKLLNELSRFEPHTVSDESGFYVEVLYLLGAPAHADLLRAFLKGDYFAGCALRRTGDGAQKDAAGIWEKLSEADRWKLLTVPGCVPKATAISYAIASLGSESPAIRGSAIRWLGQHKASEGRRPLLDRLRAEKSSLRWEIVEALAEIGGEAVVDAMVKLLARGSWAAKYLASQQFCGRLSSGRANAVVTASGEITADEQGRVYVLGNAAYGLPLTVNPDGGDYTGGGSMSEGMFVKQAVEPKAANSGKDDDKTKDGFFVVLQ